MKQINLIEWFNNLNSISQERIINHLESIGKYSAEQRLIEFISSKIDITGQEFVKAKGKHKVVLIKSYACAILHYQFGLSLQTISNLLGYENHSSVLDRIGKLTSWCSTNKGYKEEFINFAYEFLECEKLQISEKLKKYIASLKQINEL